MTQNAIATIRAIPDTLRRRNIQATKGYRFDSDWAEGLIAFFSQDHAPDRLHSMRLWAWMAPGTTASWR